MISYTISTVMTKKEPNPDAIVPFLTFNSGLE